VRSEFEIRREIVEIGRRLWERGYVAANDGNISARAGEGIVVTPTGVSKGFMQPSDLVVVSRRGDRMSGALAPTSELKMHLAVYELRDDVGAVVHAHPPRATGFAVAGEPLAQCVLPEVIMTLGQVPLAEYATPSTEEVVSSIRKLLPSYSAMLLRNHGVLTMGQDLSQAYFRMETVEHFAEITLTARALGGPNPLSSDDVRKLLNVREGLGLGDSDAGCVQCGACDGQTTDQARSNAPEVAADPRGGSAGEAATGNVNEEEIVRAVMDRLSEILETKGDVR
jgi:L-fuculose-phosphate aldolase